jgi:hypothetical protein
MLISKHAVAREYVGVVAKTASLMGPGDLHALKGLGHTMMEVAPIAVPLAALAAQGIGAVISKMTEASRKAGAYKTMMDQNPHLADKPSEDVQRYFNTLHRLNPELAGDPTVAASFVNNMVQMNNPMNPHAALFEQARQLSALKRPEPGHFGKDLSDVVLRMGDASKKDKSEGLRHDLGVQQRYNRMLKSHVQKMRRGAAHAPETT